MTDVERFFRRLVGNLAATDPGRLRGPVSLEEITRDIVPYRTNRRALRLDTSEDYELVLLRLCAGEESLVRTEPEEARERFAREIGSVNPDLEVLHAFEHVQLTLRRESLARALEPEPDAPAPSDRFDGPSDLGETELPGVEALRGLPLVEEPAVADELPETAEARVGDDGPSCVYCGGSLPPHRPVNFCPHCGQSQTQILCPGCGSEVEPGWKHCVNCGAAVGAG